MESSFSGTNSVDGVGDELGEGPHPLAKSGRGGGGVSGEHILLSDGGDGVTSVSP